MAGKPIDPERRFLRAIQEGPVPEVRPDLGPCLIYTGAGNGNGYGQFRYNDRNGYAHRYAWERANGPIPPGLTVDHLCYVRRCVRLEHLDLVDGVTNYLRGVERRTHCPKGHEYTPENTGVTSRGGRSCLTCRRNAWRRRSKPTLDPLGKRRPQARITTAQRQQMVAELMAGELTLRQASDVYGLDVEQVRRSAWREARRQVNERDRGTCGRCGRRAEEIHHRRPRQRGSTNRGDILFGLDNLVSLCRGCHSFVESWREKALATGWLVPMGVDPATVRPIPIWEAQ